MNKLRHSFSGIVLVVAFAAAPATMAEDFHALSQLSTGFTAMPEDQLASIEGTGGIRQRTLVCVNRSCRVRVNVTATNTSTNTNTNTNTNRAQACTVTNLLPPLAPSVVCS